MLQQGITKGSKKIILGLYRLEKYKPRHIMEQNLNFDLDSLKSGKAFVAGIRTLFRTISVKYKHYGQQKN